MHYAKMHLSIVARDNVYICCCIYVFINVHTQQKPKSYVLQDFTLDMYFRQFWQDPRLSFERRASLEKLVVGAEYIKLIWVPDTFFVNEKTAYFHDATTDNQFLRILHTGEILRSIRWVHKGYSSGEILWNSKYNKIFQSKEKKLLYALCD